MTDIKFSSEMTVKLVRHQAHDDYVIQAAQVSAIGENNPDTDPVRLINALMKGRHGSPFEHTSFTFFVKTPLFVFREWQRHRMSSFNEMSGRYTELPPEFYIPGSDRKMFNAGTKMKPDFISFEEYCENAMINPNGRWNAFSRDLADNSFECWMRYQKALENGIANEVARMVLPLNTYSQMYWTVNARSLMNFLSLRVESDDSIVRSYPQREIHMAAEAVETIFESLMPATHAAFVKNGRVAP
jgi:thymidylate synthase (FAD)